MIASLGRDVKPLALSSSFFFYQSKSKRGGKFLGGVVSLSRITYHSYHGLWVDYCKLINGLIAAASGALCAEVLASS